MSAIVGLYCLDGRPVDPLDLGRMVDILAHRGPDGAKIWNDGPVGLGHRMLWTTPESLHEQLPLVHETGDLVLTADARIDNRDELIAALDLTDRVPAEIADSELILGAYEKWGENCPEHLLGDFCFAIWDRQNQMVFAARDHFGVKPFYYHKSARIFAFASEIKALFCLPEVPRDLNEVRVADYLVAMFNDTEITFYQDILRLPPAHCAVVSHKGITLRSYWSLDPSRQLQLDSSEAYAEAFRELFTEAVRCRLRSAFDVGTLLSGGLDSSSVTCVARQLMAGHNGRKLHTFSGIFDIVTQCDERSYINAVLAQGDLEPHYIHADQISPLAKLDTVYWHQDEAFFAPHLFMRWELCDVAREQGIRVLLDGFDGDTTISDGFGYLKELARENRWLVLATNIRGLTGDDEPPWQATVLRYFWHCSFRPRISKHRTLNFGLRSWRAVRRRLGRRPHQATVFPARRAPINPDYAQLSQLVERYRKWQASVPGRAQTEKDRHYRAISQGQQAFALEVLEKTSAAFSIELRHPYWDKRLVEFCLALPPEQKLDKGWGRMILRRAMADILPEDVQWRRGKANFSPNLSHSLLAYERERLDGLVKNDLGVVEEYVDIAALQSVYDRFVSGETRHNAEDVYAIWLAVSLALWLQYRRTIL